MAAQNFSSKSVMHKKEEDKDKKISILLSETVKSQYSSRTFFHNLKERHKFMRLDTILMTTSMKSERISILFSFIRCVLASL